MDLYGYQGLAEPIPFSGVENNGVEPLTYCLQGSRSSQLS